MTVKHHITRLLIAALYLAFGLFGVFVGIKIIRHYQVIVQGVLGLVIFYLLYRAFLLPRTERDSSEDELLESPKIKYFLAFTFWTLIIYWALRQITMMILFFIGK